MTQLESLADAPGKSREYETVFILTPDTANDAIAKVNERVKGIVETMGGSVVKVDNWGKRKLAYEVSKQLKGIYLHWHYLGTTGLVEELERNLRMIDPVIRYMTVKLDTDVDPTAHPTEMDEEAYARAAETAADEEDLIMGAGAEGEPAEGEKAEAAAEGETAEAAEGETAEAAEGETAEAAEGETAEAAAEGETAEAAAETTETTNTADTPETEGETAKDEE
jgi:small subunit ribosomal protein S6